MLAQTTTRVGIRDGALAISLGLQMYAGAESPRDNVLTDGVSPIDMTIAGDVGGAVAAAAIVVNAILNDDGCAARPLTMSDLPLVHALNPLEKAVRKT